jgi:hypothetical protein
MGGECCFEGIAVDGRMWRQTDEIAKELVNRREFLIEMTEIAYDLNDMSDP